MCKTLLQFSKFSLSSCKLPVGIWFFTAASQKCERFSETALVNMDIPVATCDTQRKIQRSSKRQGSSLQWSKKKSLSSSCLSVKLGKALSETNLLSSKRYSSLTQLNMLGSCKSLDQIEAATVTNSEELFSRELQMFYDKRVESGRLKSLANKRLAFATAFKVLINLQLVNDRFTATDLLQRNPKYCEMTEIRSNLLEFEVPVYLEGCDQNVFVQSAEEGGFVRLAVDSEQNFNWSDCVTEEGFLSASLVRSKLQLTIQKTLMTMNYNVQSGLDNLPDDVNSVTVYCDGSTIVLDINGGEIFVDMVPCLRLHCSSLEFFKRLSKSAVPSHALAKPCDRPMSDPETLWMLSFASAERKKVLQLSPTQRRVLEILIELRELDELFGKLSLTHMQTTLFYVVDKMSDPYDWRESEMGERFIDALCSLEDFLHCKYCEHYFVKSANLFSGMSPVTITKLKDKVRRIVKPSCVACGLASLFGPHTKVKCTKKHF